MNMESNGQMEIKMCNECQAKFDEQNGQLRILDMCMNCQADHVASILHSRGEAENPEEPAATPAINGELYKKILVLMCLDNGFEADFHYRYVEQSFFDQLLKKANVTCNPSLEYIEGALTQVMDEVIAHLKKEL